MCVCVCVFAYRGGGCCCVWGMSWMCVIPGRITGMCEILLFTEGNLDLTKEISSFIADVFTGQKSLTLLSCCKCAPIAGGFYFSNYRSPLLLLMSVSGAYHYNTTTCLRSIFSSFRCSEWATSSPNPSKAFLLSASSDLSIQLFYRVCLWNTKCLLVVKNRQTDIKLLETNNKMFSGDRTEKPQTKINN